MAVPRITVGDDIGLECTLSIGGIIIPIDPSSVIRVSVSDKNRSRSYTGAITLDSADVNHTLGSAIIWVSIPGANTTTMRRGAASLEIEVNDPTRNVGSQIETWFHELWVDLTTLG